MHKLILQIEDFMDFLNTNLEAVIVNTSELQYEFKDKTSSLESLILKLKKKIFPNNIVVTRGSKGVSHIVIRMVFLIVLHFIKKLLIRLVQETVY